ncbi:MAG: aminotransferase class I/II-fold pyridoxal phosphate-dependent enzyme [Ruminococcaceae bacterium]|nr:aminotransferase class I/II-fold pyridoxal phosphate-dependent enzyme [Oscillospiraceae bacterium]
MGSINNVESFENRIYLSSPTMHGEELKYIVNAYETNWVSTVGENIDKAEESCSKYVGAKYAVGLTTGTAALHMAMKAAGVKRGDMVFASDTTFAATVNPVLYEGGSPVFIDSERETWNMDPDALEKAFEIFPDVKVVVAANLYGTPLQYDRICEICERHGAILIEDSAESLGASYKGKQTGSFGKYNVISFNGNKIITGSSGGMFVTDDFKAAEKVRKWSTQSRDNAPWYQHSEIGYNYRMSNIIAGVIRGQMRYLSEHIAQKKAIYERYKEGFKDLPVTMNPYIESDMEPNFWLSCMLIDESAMCKEIRYDSDFTYEKEPGKSCPGEILGVLSDYNVEARPLWKPMHVQPIFKKNVFITADGISNGESKESVGCDIFRRGLCLPSDIKMTEEEQDIIIQLIKSCFE